MDPSRSHRLIHVINNCDGQYITNSKTTFLCFDLSFIKLLIKLEKNKNCLESYPGPMA